MARGMWLGVGALTVALATAWLWKERLGAAVGLPPPAATSASGGDVLYSWVDPQGVTHYEQDDGQGRRLQYDGSRITPLAPVDSGLADRVRVAAGDAAAPVGPGSGGTAGTAPQGSTILQGLRAEMEANARQMQEARAAQRGL